MADDEDRMQDRTADPLKEENERLKAAVLVAEQKAAFSALLLEHREKQAAAFTEHERSVRDDINKRLGALSFVGLLVASLAIWGAIQPVRQLVKDRLEKEFASENIKKSIAAAAESQARQLLESTLKPAVDDARIQIAAQQKEVKETADRFRRDSLQELDVARREFKGQQTEVQKSMAGLRDDYRKELGSLKIEVDHQRQMRELQALKN